MSTLKSFTLLFYTLIHLRPQQVFGQIKHRLKSKIFGKREFHKKGFNYNINKNISLLIPELESDLDYLERFDLDSLYQGQITLLCEEHYVDISKWYVSEASHLWNYNLNYLEFLIPIAFNANRTNNHKAYLCWKRYMNSWLEASNEDRYESYTISLRIPNILICLELLSSFISSDSIFLDSIYSNIYSQYRYLDKNKETWLLANHYLENLKTLVICSILFNENKRFQEYFSLFILQLKEQILPDGMHYELSPMYHKLILEDVLRVRTVLVSNGLVNETSKLDGFIKRMTSAMCTLEEGLARTPLFNDSGDNVSKSMRSLLLASQRIIPGQIGYLAELAYAGYYRLQNEFFVAIVDCGTTGPKYMGGHAHCDCLSFELAIKGELVFVNSGTYQYQGDKRSYFRSTRAHNTVVINGKEQSECWGEHRLARRVKVSKPSFDTFSITGEYETVHKDYHTRRYQLEDSYLQICDSIITKTNALVSSFFHLANGCYARGVGNRIIISKNNQDLCFIDYMSMKVFIHTEGELTYYSPEFGMIEKSQCIEFQWNNDGKDRWYSILAITGEN